MSPSGSNAFVFACLIVLLSIHPISLPPVSAGAPLISPVSQERYVDTHANAGGGSSWDGDGDYDEAPDFAPFDSSIGSYASAQDGTNGALATAAASQSSAIGADSIQSSGAVSYYMTAYGSDSGADIGATSKTSVTFLLTEESDYEIQGTLNPYAGRAYLSLTTAGGTIHDLYAFWNPVAVQESGTLPAGEYTFEVRSVVEDGIWGPFVGIDGGSEHAVTLQFGPFSSGGEVPDGLDVPGGPPLQVDRLANEFVRLTWGLSCRLGDDDYAVYEGELGDPLSLARVTCSTAGQLAHEFQPVEDDAWFVVVPTDGVIEGSYGDTSEGVERMPSSTACWPQLLGDPICP